MAHSPEGGVDWHQSHIMGKNKERRPLTKKPQGWIWVLALALAFNPAQARSQTGAASKEPVQAHPEGDEAISKLKSPYCPGLMLEVCPSTPAKLLRDSIHALAWEGADADSIVGWMLAGHGEQYRAVPLTTGSGLWAWAMPPFVLLAGLGLVAVVLKRFRAAGSGIQQRPRDLSEEDEKALAAAMDELRASEEVPF